MGLCKGCAVDIPRLTRLCCPQCALPTPQGEVCGACLRAPPAFSVTHAALQYAWPLDRLIWSYKYRGDVALAKPLGRWLAQSIRDAHIDIQPPDCMLPMPLHHQRQRERGFNQSLQLAKCLREQLHIPLAADLAARNKLTPPQASLPWAERRKCLRGAFSVSGEVANRHIAIIDDVMTTGASLDELAKTLLTAGARRVDCWVLARTIHQ